MNIHEYQAKELLRAAGAPVESDAELDKVAWHGGNSGGMANPVGELVANPYGLHDLRGNVYEWCQAAADQEAAQIPSETRPPDLSTGTTTDNGMDLRRHRQQRERRLIDAALSATGGNVSAAARRLNVSRQLVHYKMRQYGLVRQVPSWNR